jgi:hypothetical protein
VSRNPIGEEGRAALRKRFGQRVHFEGRSRPETE